jgi:hypothetical protein
MRTSLNEIEESENFLAGRMGNEESVLFQAKLILSPALRLNTDILKKTFSIIRSFGRRELTKEIAAIDKKLFTASAHHLFQKEITDIFFKT